MDSRKYLRYGAGWAGVVVGMFAYSGLVAVIGIHQLAVCGVYACYGTIWIAGFLAWSSTR